MKRKTLFSALFDVETQKCSFNIAIVTAYVNLQKETFEVRVKSGWIDLPFYKEDIPIKKIEKLDTLKKLYSFCKYALEETISAYDGKKKISDFYISPAFQGLMMGLFGKINVGKNEETPEKY